MFRAPSRRARREEGAGTRPEDVKTSEFICPLSTIPTHALYKVCYNCPMSKVRRSTEFKNNSRVIDMDEAREKRQAKRKAQRDARKKREAAKIKEPPTRGKRAIRRKRNRTRLMAALVIVAVFAVLAGSGVHVISLLKERHQLDKQHEALLQQKAELEKKLEGAEDKQALEDAARQELRLIKPGETLYMFPADFGQDKEDE